jgi:histidine triad (HIT) family protein
MQDSVFTKIINREIPAHIIYEDDMSIVIVPLEVIAKGHVLVIPKLQVDQFFDLPDEEYQALMITVKKVAAQMKEIYKTARVGMQVVGLDVPHAHVHVVAFDTLEEFYGVAGGGTVDEPKLVELTQKLGV